MKIEISNLIMNTKTDGSCYVGSSCDKDDYEAVTNKISKLLNECNIVGDIRLNGDE